MSSKAAIEALKQRYVELCAREAFIPYEFNLHLPEEVVLDDVIDQLLPNFFTNEKSGTNTPNRPALALALFGWQGLTNTRIGAVANTASCHTCQRRLGLWMFKSKEVDESGNIIVPAPMDYLDPEREHRFFCPWKNAAAQSRGHVTQSSSDTADMPAWKMLLQSIKNESDLRMVYEGRARSPSKLTAKGASTPHKTPTRPAGSGHVPQISVDLSVDGEEDEATRDAKDKERWAKLRKVKSLFDTKKLRKSVSSRPETAASIKSNRSIKGD
jgi:hypothetical protein